MFPPTKRTHPVFSWLCGCCTIFYAVLGPECSRNVLGFILRPKTKNTHTNSIGYAEHPLINQSPEDQLVYRDLIGCGSFGENVYGFCAWLWHPTCLHVCAVRLYSSLSCCFMKFAWCRAGLTFSHQMYDTELDDQYILIALCISFFVLNSSHHFLINLCVVVSHLSWAISSCGCDLSSCPSSFWAKSISGWSLASCNPPRMAISFPWPWAYLNSTSANWFLLRHQASKHWTF